MKEKYYVNKLKTKQQFHFFINVRVLINARKLLRARSKSEDGNERSGVVKRAF